MRPCAATARCDSNNLIPNFFMAPAGLGCHVKPVPRNQPFPGANILAIARKLVVLTIDTILQHF